MSIIGVILVIIPVLLSGYQGMLHKYFEVEVYTSMIIAGIILCIGTILLCVKAIREKNAVVFTAAIFWALFISYLIFASGA